MDAINRFLQQAAKRQDIVFAVFFVLIVAMLIIPLPVWLVDTLLAINLTVSLLVLLTAIYLKSVLDITAFPSIILVTAIFRVALSVSTTRLILAYGDAGHLITGFGNFVIAGNIVVGLVVFLIIAIVQFMVVTKGAERIAEVGARFTLDAMPGKQMAIDNDVRAGDITKEEARIKRRNLEKEMSFHGSMDGAMRFVKGDAIASLIIVFVNLIGGLLIGILQRGMSFSEAGALYTLLSVGDGLIAQIPAMFIALAAGAIVTKIESEESKDMGTDISNQLFAEPKAMGIAAVVAACMGLVPGFPTVVFFGIGAALGGVTYMMVRNRKIIAAGGKVLPDTPGKPADPGAPAAGDEEGSESGAPAMAPDQRVPLRITEPGDVLVMRGNREFLSLFENLRVFQPILRGRERFTKRFGFPSPSLGFQYDQRIKFGDLIADVDDVPSARLSMQGVEPNTPLKDEHIRQLAQFIYAQWSKNASALFGMPQAQAWLSSLEATLGRLVTDVQQVMPFMILVDVLRKLLEERVGLTPPRLVLEGIMHAAPRSQDPDMIADLTRVFLRRQICFEYCVDGRVIEAFLVSPEFDETFQAMRGGGRPNEQMTQLFVRKVKAAMEGRENGANNRGPVILSSGDIRRVIRRLLSEQGVDVPVLGYNEVSREFEVKNLGIIDTSAARAA